MTGYRIRKGYSALSEVPESDRPRERLLRMGAGAMTDEELMMLVIGSGNSARPVNKIADELLSLLDRNPDAALSELMLIPGLGMAKASAITAALELGRRRIQWKGRAVSTPADIFHEVHHYASRTQENLVVVSLNGAHEIISTVIATIGLLNTTIVHPREVFSEPLRKCAAAIAIAHNHPSGNTEPSQDDKDVTKRLIRCGEILGIRILDHIVFTDEKYYSFLEHGLM